MGDSTDALGAGNLEQLQACLLAAREQCHPQLILDFIPYSSFIGAQAKVAESEVLYWLEPRRSNIGNPSLPALHGGVIAGFLELSASVELLFGLKLNSMPNDWFQHHQYYLIRNSNRFYQTHTLNVTKSN